MSAAEIASIIVAVAALFGVIATVLRIGNMSGAMQQSLATQNATLSKMESELSKLSDILTKMAVERERVNNLSERITSLDSNFSSRLKALDQLVDDLRRGEGLIMPLSDYFKPRT